MSITVDPFICEELSYTRSAYPCDSNEFLIPSNLGKRKLKNFGVSSKKHEHHNGFQNKNDDFAAGKINNTASSAVDTFTDGEMHMV